MNRHVNIRLCRTCMSPFDNPEEDYCDKCQITYYQWQKDKEIEELEERLNDEQTLSDGYYSDREHYIEMNSDLENLMEQEVIIEVKGGVVDMTKCPDEFNITVVDHDLGT